MSTGSETHPHQAEQSGAPVLPYDVLWSTPPNESMVCIDTAAALAIGGLPLKPRTVNNTPQLYARGVREGEDLVLLPRRIRLHRFPFHRLSMMPLACTVDRIGNLEQAFRIVIESAAAPR